MRTTTSNQPPGPEGQVSHRFGAGLFGDLLWLAVGYGGRTLAFFGVTVLLTRSLGAEGYGTLSLFMAYALGLSYLCGSWPFLAVPVLAASEHDVGAAFRPAALVAGWAGALGLLVLLPLAWATLTKDFLALAALAVFSLMLIGLQGVYGFLQAEGRMRGIAVVQTGERTIALIALSLLAALASLTIVSAEVTLALAATAACFLAFGAIARRRPIFGEAGGEGGPTIRAAMATVGPMAVVTVCAYVVAWIDIFVIAAFRSHSDVGVYSLAQQILMFLIQLGSLWITATLPRHAKSTSAGLSFEDQLPIPQLRASSQAWAGAVGLAAVPIVLLIPRVFGEEFRDSAVPLMLLLCGATLFAPYIATVSAMIGSGKTRLLAWTSLGAAALNLTIDFALVPAIGIVGAGIATLVQGTFNAVLIVWLARGPRALWAVGKRILPVAVLTGIAAIDPYSAPLLAALGAVSAVALLAGGRELLNGITRTPAPLGEENVEPLIDAAGGGP